jgi:MFS family permease
MAVASDAKLAPSATTGVKLGMLSVSSAMAFVILLGLTSLFGDMTYQGGRGLHGQYLNVLGASAVAVGVAAGAGELLGYGLRLPFGIIADRTGRYWTLTLIGYSINILAIPAMALAGRWEIAVLLLFAERIGKAIRNPARDSMLSYATKSLGRGWGFGLHEVLDKTGSLIGPVLMTGVLLSAVGPSGEGADVGVSTYQFSYGVLIIPAALSLLTLLIARFYFPRPRDLESKTPKISSHGFGREYWWYVAATGLVAAGFADFPLMAYHFKNLALVPDPWIPLVYGCALALAGITGLVGGKLYDRIGSSVVAGVFFIGAFFAPFAFLGNSFAVVAIGLILWGIGIGAQESIMRAVVGDLAAVDRRGHAYGMFHTTFGICWFAGSALMGLLYTISIPALVVFSMAAQLIAVPIFLAGRPRTKVATA